MKCPHCGMNIRDTIEDCGYCGGKIVKEAEKSPSGTGKPDSPGGSVGAKRGSALQEAPPSEEEEEGGISVYLQPGEMELIGSLNIAVKKFFFHAYLTNQRIFLIDTEEKKVKVTAKDIPHDTIAGSYIEYSENSDPVLVLSLKAADDELKTMKLIFIQNGMDRSEEINEWIALIQEQGQLNQGPEQTIEEQKEHREEPLPTLSKKPVQKQELHPKRKPAKDHEKQPPVKRHIVFQTGQDQGAEAEEPLLQRRSHVREMPEPEPQPVLGYEPFYEISPAKKADTQPLRKREVQSAMKVAMKSAMQPLKQSSLQTVKRPVIERIEPSRREAETGDTERTPSKPVIQKNVQETENEGTGHPPFCQNCGKKIPPAANFCPGCGTKLGVFKAGSLERISASPPAKKTTHHDAPVRDKKGTPPERGKDADDKQDDITVSTKPPAKKGPKGAEMTILHKFLRR